MDIQKRFAEMLVPVSKKISAECHNFLPESARPRPPANYMRIIFQLIKKELTETLKVVAMVNPRKGDWHAIRKTGAAFIQEQGEMLKEEFYERWGEEYFNEKEFETLRKEIVAEYNTFIDGRLLILGKKGKKFLFDIVKGVIVGIIGSMIIYYLTSLIFEQPPGLLLLVQEIKW